ncbi:MAG: hypothetical protein ACOX0A_04730 [Thermoguttaceae bacterium]|jgi:uncharacterized repeat protein (TIGR01451 family)
MKRSALQCVAGFVGATLIIIGVVWTCRQLSSPTQLNAAQDTQESGFTRPSASPRGPANVMTPPLASRADSVRAPEAQSPSRIRQTAASSLSLSLVDSEEQTEEQPDDLAVSFNDEIPEPLPPQSPFDDTIFSLEEPLPFEADADAQFPSPPSNSLDLVPDDEIEAELPFPVGPVAAPLEDDSQLLQDANVPQRGQVAASSLSLYEVDDDFPQGVSSDPLAAAAPLPVMESPLDSSEADPLVAPQNTDPLLPEVKLGGLQDQARQIPAIDSETEPLNSFAAPRDRKAVSNYVDSIVSSQATPGDSELEGPQTTQIIVEKLAPEEVQTNKPAVITIKVKNNGAKTVRHILVHETIPQGAQFISADQDVVPTPQGDLFWAPFDLEPQREKKFEYSVVPSEEGDFGSVATVLLPIEASSRTKSSRPELKVEASAPESVELGENVNFDIVVTNVGTGTAYNVALLETIPEGLYHPSGAALDNKLGVLKAGESKQLPLALKAVAPGECVNRLSVSADDCEPQEIETLVRVTAPELELGIKGVTNAYLEQSTLYKLTINNVGDTSARHVRLVAQLPESVKFVKANNLGAYKDDEHSVYWDLAELPAQTNGEVELTIKSTEPDEVELVFIADGPNNLSTQTSKRILIDGLAALSFNVSSSLDLIESGKELEYTVTIVNNGTKASSNVTLQILAPEAISILATDGPTQATNRNGVVVFDRIPEIGPKSTATFKIKASANQAGDCRVGFQLSSDDLDPLVKEINTRVYE